MDAGILTQFLRLQFFSHVNFSPLPVQTLPCKFQSYKLHGFSINNLIICMLKSRIDPDKFVPEKPTDPDLHYFPERGISGLRRIKAQYKLNFFLENITLKK